MSAPYLGDFREDQTVHFLWSSNGADGASITRATDGTISVYKDNDGTQTTTGVTDDEDFDSLTGIHACTIATTDAFYVVGANYTAVLSGATIDGKTVNAVLAHFSIENRFNEVDVTKWLGSAVATPTNAGVPEVDVTHAAGAAQASIATQASVDTVDDLLDTEITAIISSLSTIAGYIDTEVAALTSAVADLPTNSELTTALAGLNDISVADILDAADAVETDVTPRGALRLMLAALAGKLSGAGTDTETFRNAAADSKDRIVATVDSSGNRSAITLDAS